jgi:hypothetical protein
MKTRMRIWGSLVLYDSWNTVQAKQLDPRENQYTRLKDPKRVNLARKLPIAVTYYSRLNLRPDVYGLDRKQLEAISQPQQTLSADNPDSHESNLTRRAR